jgi:chromosome condensin MukBEF MukE localization factor
MYSSIRRDQGVAIVQKYDKKSLYLMLIKWYEHLHLSMKRLANEGIFN